ncbi:hypothetical protein JHK85_015755 [Glycine max]|nr:hypothetical protein JHK85_015755 [Glycine max]
MVVLASRINILANRLDLWYEYASLISSLIREGFSPSTIEETTDISSIDQNRLIVGAQIRLLSASQRMTTAHFLVENRCDGKAPQELAPSVKDFPSRREDKGLWNGERGGYGGCRGCCMCSGGEAKDWGGGGSKFGGGVAGLRDG